MCGFWMSQSKYANTLIRIIWADQKNLILNFVGQMTGCKMSCVRWKDRIMLSIKLIEII